MSATLTGRNLIAGRWLPANGERFESRSPARESEVLGVFPCQQREEAQTGRRRGPRRLSRLAAHQPHPSRRAVRQPRPDRQARDRRPRPADGPRVRQGRHRVPGRGRRRAAHDPVRLRHRPHADRARCWPRRSPRRTPSCAASRGASSPSSRRGTSPSPCRCGCSGRACSKATRPSSSRPRTRRPSASGWSSCSRRPAFPPGVINLVHGDGEAGEALVRNPRRQRRPVHRQLRRRPAHPADVRRALRPHRRLRDGQQERGHRLRRRPARSGGQLRRSSAASRPAASAASRRAASSSHEKLFDRFAEKLVATAKRLRIGDPLDAGNFTGPVIHRGAVEKMRALQRPGPRGRRRGAARRRPDDRRRARATAATCRRSSIAWSIGPGVRCIREEVFGPHLALIPFKDNEDAVADLQRHATMACRWR